eukprot:gene315-328_t
MATIEAAYHEPRLGGKRRSFLADEDGANSQSVQMDDNTLSTVLHSVGGTLNTCKRSDDFHEILVWEYSFPYKVCGLEEPPPAYASTERTTVEDITPELSGHTSTAGDMIGHYMGREFVGGMTNGHMAPVQLRSPRKSKDNIKVSEKAVLRISKSEAEAEEAAVYSGRKGSAAFQTRSLTSEEPQGSRSQLVRNSVEEGQCTSFPVPGVLQRRLHVLVVDDTSSIQKVMRRWLQSEGCTVTVAGNGREGLDLMTSRPFDLTFLDFMM